MVRNWGVIVCLVLMSLISSTGKRASAARTFRHFRDVKSTSTSKAGPSIVPVTILDKVNEGLMARLDQLERPGLGNHGANTNGEDQIFRGLFFKGDASLQPATEGAGGLRFKKDTPFGLEKFRFESWDPFSTNDEVPFPYWSPTARKDGDPLGMGTGLCFVGFLPWIHMKKSELSSTKMGALKETLGIRNECVVDDQCESVAGFICNQEAFYGMNLRPFCFRGLGDNACACGVSLEYITHRQFCHPKNMYGPSYSIKRSDKDKYNSMMDTIMKLPPVMNGPLLGGSSSVYAIADHILPVIGDFLDDFQKFPLWSTKKGNGNLFEKSKSDKNNWSMCVIGFLPFVRCDRTTTKSVSQALSGDGFGCFRDEDCNCYQGCGGPFHQGPEFARWQPLCWTRGKNVCICALVTDMVTEDRCMQPTTHKHHLKGAMTEKAVTVYYGGKDLEYSPYDMNCDMSNVGGAMKSLKSTMGSSASGGCSNNDDGDKD